MLRLLLDLYEEHPVFLIMTLGGLLGVSSEIVSFLERRKRR